MSVLPDEWGQPHSFPGLIHDVLWAVLAILVFGALAYFEPFSIDINVTPGRLSRASALGIGLGVAVSYLSFDGYDPDKVTDEQALTDFVGTRALIVNLLTISAGLAE